MRHTLRLLMLPFLAFTACTTVKLGIPSEFSSQATELHVKGLNGFTVNQKLVFGEYETSKIKNGWVRTQEKNDRMSDVSTEDRLLKVFNIDNSNKTTSSDTKYQYSLYGGGLEAKIYSMERKSTEETDIRTQIKWLGDFSSTKNSRYSFSAAILPLIPNFDEPWQVVLYSNYEAKKDTAKRLFDLPYAEEDGYATNGKETITIRTIRTKNMTTTTGRSVNMPVKLPAGYELRIDDGVIGIIDTYDNNVWIYNELDKNTRFIIASISSSILLRKLESTESTD
ncbi:hypothetical protein GZH53_01335 [Flavihumibacter sp. R14]|nr:hypothetical protein [Flavihumibacter soli]